MLDLLAFAATVAGAGFGYLVTRRFVRERLKFVDAAQRISAPIVAGVVAWALAMPLVWLLPLIGPGAALVFGVAVGLGVRSGAKDIRIGRQITAG